VAPRRGFLVALGAALGVPWLACAAAAGTRKKTIQEVLDLLESGVPGGLPKDTVDTV
jgi:hypothetical protein